MLRLCGYKSIDDRDAVGWYLDFIVRKHLEAITNIDTQIMKVSRKPRTMTRFTDMMESDWFLQLVDIATFIDRLDKFRFLFDLSRQASSSGTTSHSLHKVDTMMKDTERKIVHLTEDCEKILIWKERSKNGKFDFGKRNFTTQGFPTALQTK